MSATATRGGRGRVHAAVEFVLRSIADEILIVLTQSDLVLLTAIRVIRIRRRAVAPPHPPHLERRDANFKIAQSHLSPFLQPAMRLIQFCSST